MAVTKRAGETGSFYNSSGGNFFSSPVESGGKTFGTLLDFSVDYQGKKVTGTYNPSQGGGGVAVTQNAGFVNDTANLLEQGNNFSLGAAQNAVNMNQSENPFFGEFFKYYLGIAQERQALLTKSLGRTDMLSSGSAASMIGGSLL
jgi:hypothetical protein